jgi:hypothetical protein
MTNSPRRRLVLTASVLAAGLILAGCPGTDRMTSPSNQIVTDTLSAAVAQTGSVWSGAEGSGLNAMAFPNTDVLVGDQDGFVNGTAVRGFIGFNLTVLPKGISLQQATLTATQCDVSNNPFDNLGAVVVQHVSYPVPLDTTPFFVAPLDATLDTLSNTTPLGVRTIVVTSSVSADIANSRASSQYRLSMSSTDLNADGNSDFVVFAADSAHTTDCHAANGQQPRLVLLYRPAP